MPLTSTKHVWQQEKTTWEEAGKQPQSKSDVSDSSSPNKSKSRAITGISRYLWQRKTAAIKRVPNIKPEGHLGKQ